MTTRQMLSIVLSTILFGHTMGTEALLGAVVVFLAVFHSIHRQVRESREKRAAKDLPAAAAPEPHVAKTSSSSISKEGLELVPPSSSGK